MQHLADFNWWKPKNQPLLHNKRRAIGGSRFGGFCSYPPNRQIKFHAKFSRYMVDIWDGLSTRDVQKFWVP